MDTLKILQKQLETNEQKIEDLYVEAERIVEENKILTWKIKAKIGLEFVGNYFGSVSEFPDGWSTYTFVKSINEKGEIETITLRFLNNGKTVEQFKDFSLPDYKTEHSKRITPEEYSAGIARFHSFLEKV